ncbi:DUF3732 domain-containing protein [Geodermatophilus amargosae]|uniref:DUF3732 domain-containing protein n=1 Tax=Geodermatophilus amargosae TaxID=1296565 RepID=UPI0034DFC48C
MMQLDQLVLYGPQGQQRSILFRPGRLNIITGESGTGKTSIIAILRFLLGDNSPHAPLGPIQRTVQWYGLLAHVDETSFFIGRPAPPHGATTTRASLVIGQSTVPDMSQLQANISAVELRDYLGGLLGIEDNLNEPAVGQTRRPLSATFVHSLYYCFQGQGEVANPDILFHRQNREWQPQTIRDTLPYFLGAQGIDALRKREELARLRRTLRSRSQELAGIEQMREGGIGRVSGLLANAREAGLIERSLVITSWPEAFEVLQAALVNGLRDGDVSSAGEEADNLIARRADLRAQYRANSLALRGLDDYADIEDDFIIELNEHRSRLASIGLMPDAAPDAECPLCSHQLPESIDWETSIGSELEAVNHRLSSARRDRPRVESARADLVEARTSIRRALDEVEAALESLSRDDDLRRLRRQLWEQQSFTKGRIAQFLETTALASDAELDALRAAVEALTRDIEGLTSELDPDALRSRVNSILNIISRRMTDWARELGLEHSQDGARIDSDRLTIVADTPDGPAYMDTGEIGSGMNWVGYHLTAYLALQEFFITRRRPVPSFVVVDQPSQAFFPRDRQEGGDLDELADVDREHTRQLYRLMHTVTGRLEGALQVIAFDHADFEDEWFQESVVERWRGGQALIPKAWYEG